MAILAPSGLACAADDVLKLDTAEFLRSDSTTPPPDSAPWQTVKLPDYWRSTRPGTSGFAWYRLRFSIAQRPQRQQALFFPSLRTVGTVYVNGAWVGQNGTVQDPLPERMEVFPLRPELLQAGMNTLDIRLWSNPGGFGGSLSTVRLGDEIPVMVDEGRYVFLQTTVPQVVGVFSATIGLYMLLVWLQRRGDTMYVYFALAAIVVAIWSYPWLTWTVVNVPYELRLALVRFKAPLLFMCFLRLAGWHWPRTERAIWLLTTLVACLDIVSLLARSNELAIHASRYATLLPNGAATALALWMVWRLRSAESAVLALGQSLSFALLVLGVMPYPLEEWPHLGFFNLMPVFLAMGWILTLRFVGSLNEAERLNADLEKRVAQKHAELQRNYAQLEQLTRRAAVAEERHRIMSDMHDGIGGQLISTLNLVEHGGASTKEVAVALRECIDDLRLIIDSLQPADDDLLPVLGNLRYRLEGRLKQQGITLDWQVGEVPKLSCLTPENVLQVLRILQEAFTNILKHAHASRISVSTSVQVGGVSIRVSDNGCGFNDSQGTGHGLANMRDRARRIGGALEVTPSPVGTTLALSLPIA